MGKVKKEKKVKGGKIKETERLHMWRNNYKAKKSKKVRGKMKKAKGSMKEKTNERETMRN